jgi:ketosteroid isomerase-like protein
MVHPHAVIAFPGFSERGRKDFLAGFRDFCQNTRVHEFRECDSQVNVVGDVAVATFRYDMLYERAGKRSRSTGRDLRVFQKHAAGWIAVWRTMLDVRETDA